MAHTENTQLAEITKELDARFQKGLTLTSFKSEELKHLDQVATALRAKGYLGKIAFAGQSSSGTYSVQFNVDNDGGYSSVWPQWAYELAKLSLLNNKKLYVISNGDPFGANLIQVLIFA
ncbi:MAG: hypothetical protein HY785_28460 [Oscillatoriophycideae cyanobacterium NC_groundwater_1537_Pr4_S-0.65um_50_18]|nr:hypothetical protein [Oscillatoriophycideae cyanobacterium NC_groundwater_1537_Pr4_S-0.65um_50_18]